MSPYRYREHFVRTLFALYCTRYYADDVEDFRARVIEQPVPPVGDIGDDYVAVFEVPTSAAPVAGPSGVLPMDKPMPVAAASNSSDSEDEIPIISHRTRTVPTTYERIKASIKQHKSGISSKARGKSKMVVDEAECDDDSSDVVTPILSTRHLMVMTLSLMMNRKWSHPCLYLSCPLMCGIILFITASWMARNRVVLHL